MLLKNRLFPYPVLTQFRETSSYQNVAFGIHYSINEENLKITLDVDYTITDKAVERLIDSGECDVRLLLECSYTNVRETYIFDKTRKLLITLNKNELFGTVNIVGFIVAKQEINDFESENLIDLYSGRKYKFDCHDIIGFFEAESFTVSHDPVDAQKIESIFSVIKSLELTETFMVDLDQDPKKVLIYVPATIFDSYDNVKGYLDETKDIFFSILIMPALIHVLTALQHDESVEEIEDIEQKYKWFKSIEFSFEKAYNRPMVINDIKNPDETLIQIAQKLLGFCSINAMDRFTRFLINGFSKEGGFLNE